MSSREPTSFNLIKYFSEHNDESSFWGSSSEDVDVVNIPQLEEIFSSLENPYCCWGNLAKENVYRQTLKIDGLDCGTLERPDIDKIRSLSKPAPFGKGGETIFDESVRRASEISGDRIENVKLLSYLSGKIPLPYPSGIKRKEALYKLHMYEAPGGKFEMHRDTPHGKNHMGTFIVCLPTEFEGGDLVVHSSNGEETRLGCRYNEKGDVQAWWAFFYTDCEHAVEPVISGTRIVLQYDFFLDEKIEPEPIQLVDRDYHYRNCSDESIDSSEYIRTEIIPKDYSSYSISLDKSLKSQVKNAKLSCRQSETLVRILEHFIEKKVNLGIVLSHMYPTFGAMEVGLLRGRDRLLYNCIMDVKDRLPPMNIVFRYLVNNQQDPRGYEVISRSYILEPTLVQHKANKSSQPEPTADLVDEEPLHNFDALKASLNEADFRPYKQANLIVAHHPGGYFKDVSRKSGCDYTGNESMPGKVAYVSCVLIIEFFKPSPCSL